MDTIDLGNNESLVYGVFPNQDGTFTAMTYTKSKTFKTESGARRWLECSGQQKLATALEFFQYRFSDSFGGNPPLYSCGLSAL